MTDTRPGNPFNGPSSPGRSASIESDSSDVPRSEVLAQAPGGTSVPGANGSAPTSDASPTAASDNAANLARQRDEYYDLLLRKTAEFDNYKKRVERERRELSEYTTGEVLKDLLPVLDDFDRALAAARGDDASAFRQGVELIQKRLIEALAKRGVTVLDPLGQDFDPHLHEAVARQPASDHRDGEIIEVFNRGYRLGDRLLRPALVKVATA